MPDKHGLEAALNSLRKVIDDLKASSKSTGQPDPSVSLIEDLSAIADSLSAYQDEVTAEAYPGMERKRRPVRRHRR